MPKFTLLVNQMRSFRIDIEAEDENQAENKFLEGEWNSNDLYEVGDNLDDYLVCEVEPLEEK